MNEVHDRVAKIAAAGAIWHEEPYSDPDRWEPLTGRDPALTAALIVLAQLTDGLADLLGMRPAFVNAAAVTVLREIALEYRAVIEEATR